MTTQLTAEAWEPSTGAARAGAGREGVLAMAPIVVGLLPMALGVGATAAVSGLPPLVGWASSAVLYGPSGQLTLFEVMGGGGSVLVTVVACLAVNAQMAVYGFGMRPFWTDAPRWWRGLAAHLLTSPVFALAKGHHRGATDPAARRSFYLGAGLTLWLSWLAATGAGYLFAADLPDSPLIPLMTPLVLMTLAVSAVRDRSTLVALVVGVVVALLAGSAPHDLGFLGGGLAGVACALVAENRPHRRGLSS